MSTTVIEKTAENDTETLAPELTPQTVEEMYRTLDGLLTQARSDDERHELLEIFTRAMP